MIQDTAVRVLRIPSSERVIHSERYAGESALRSVAAHGVLLEVLFCFPFVVFLFVWFFFVNKSPIVLLSVVACCGWKTK